MGVRKTFSQRAIQTAQEEDNPTTWERIVPDKEEIITLRIT
jgi:hypothetical protein